MDHKIYPVVIFKAKNLYVVDKIMLYIQVQCGKPEVKMSANGLRIVNGAEAVQN